MTLIKQFVVPAVTMFIVLGLVFWLTGCQTTPTTRTSLKSSNSDLMDACKRMCVGKVKSYNIYGGDCICQTRIKEE